MVDTLAEAKTKATKALEYLKRRGNIFSDYSTDDVRKAITNLEGGVPFKSRDTRVELGRYNDKQGLIPLIIKMLKALERLDLEQKYLNLSELLKVCTNFTSLTPLIKLRTSFVKSSAIDILLSMLKPSIDNDRELTLSIDILVLLGNCVDLDKTLVRNRYRSCNAVPVLMEYLKSAEVILKIRSLAVLAYIVNDKESDIIAFTGNSIVHVVDMLKQALEGEDRWVHSNIGGISYFTGLYGLLSTTNRLAINDTCKREIVKHGGVPIIIQILNCERSGQDTKQCAIEILWQLAFVDSHHGEITKHLTDSDTVKVLHELQESGNRHNRGLREASTGLLWKLNLIDIFAHNSQPMAQIPRPSRDEPDADPPIFISYSWRNNQEKWVNVLKRLADRLNLAGCPVKIDIDKMSGNVLIAMADAIRKSSVVLVCCSIAYQSSVYCHQVASFASICKKPIILLRMEDNYEPDGWLGSLAAGKSCFDVFTDERVEREMPRIIREIKMLAPTLNETRCKSKAEQKEN